MNPLKHNFSIWCQELLRKYKSNFSKEGILFLCKSSGKLIIQNRMVPRKHLQERRCMSMKHYIFQAVRFLIGADSFVTTMIITQQWWVTEAHFPMFSSFLENWLWTGGNALLLCSAHCTENGMFAGLSSLFQGSAYIDRTQYWEIWHPAFQLSV